MKNITDTLTPLMDKFRAKTGLTDKLTVARATSLMDHLDLHVNQNLLDATTYSVQSKQTDPYPEWDNLIVYQNLRADIPTHLHFLLQAQMVLEGLRLDFIKATMTIIYMSINSSNNFSLTLMVKNIRSRLPHQSMKDGCMTFISMPVVWELMNIRTL